jgi:hypothetical protein
MNAVEMKLVSVVLEDHDSVEKHVNQSVMLHDFRRDVQAAIPGCRTTALGDHQCWVYMPDDHFTMGVISYGKHTQNGRGPSSYAVRSRTIINSKYSSGVGRNTVTSTDRAVAVKNAKKYLRKWAPNELMDMTRAYPRDAIASVREASRAGMATQELALFGGQLPNRRDALVMAELRHLLNSNHAFLDRTIAEQLTQYFGSWDEDFSLRNGHSMHFVALSVSHGRQRFDVISLDGVDGWYPKFSSAVQTYYEDVPEHILGRLSVLNMVEDRTYVQGVGYRHTAGLFYVVK